MKLLEFIITETSDEDRAIVSLSSSLATKLQSLESRNQQEIALGKIGDLVDTPLVAVNDIKIQVTDEDRILDVLGKTKESDSITSGVWDPNTDTIWINYQALSKPKLQLIRLISHELRHALDDMKSDYRASESDRYDTPKNPKHRKKDPYYPTLPYLAKPSEINARFLEVLTHLTRSMSNNVTRYGLEGLRERSIRDLFDFMEMRDILHLFPEKEKSKDYKRLLKRGVEYIEKEIEHLQSKSLDTSN